MHNELGIPVLELPLAVKHFFANLLRGCRGLGCLSLDRRDAYNFRSVSFTNHVVEVGLTNGLYSLT